MKMAWRLKGAACAALALATTFTMLPAAALDFSPMVLRRPDTRGLVSELFLYDLTVPEINQLRQRLRTPQPLAEDMFSLSFEPSLAELVPELTAGQSDQLLSMLRPVSATRLGQMQDTVLIVFQGTTLHARRYRMESTASAPSRASAVASVAAVTSVTAVTPLTPVTAGQGLRPSAASVTSDSVATGPANSEVIDAVKRWALAWSQRDVSTYSAAYESDFRGAGGLQTAASNAAWLAQRRERILSKRVIEVELDDLQVSMLPKLAVDVPQAQVRFVQRYRGDALRTVSRKRLTLVLRGGSWLIREEVAQ